MLMIHDAPYELKYSLATMDAIEGTLNGVSLIGYLADRKMPTVAVLRALFCFALVNNKEEEIELTEATGLFEMALKSMGVKKLYDYALGRLYQDLGFLFRAD